MPGSDTGRDDYKNEVVARLPTVSSKVSTVGELTGNRVHAETWRKIKLCDTRKMYNQISVSGSYCLLALHACVCV